MIGLRDLFASPFTPQPVPLDALQRLVDLALAILDQLPAVVLTSRDRQVLAGHALPAGALVSTVVTRALRQAPTLFPVALVRESAQLDLLGARATLWLCLQQALRAAAQRAEDQYLLTRAARIERCMQVLRHYRHEDGALDDSMDDDAARRDELLAPARDAITAWVRRDKRRQAW